MREGGLNDYLLLLSICQTCRYKGVSFLKFLLSREQDVDAFRKRQQRRRPLSSLELNPEGFVPSHFASLHMKKLRREHWAAEVPEPES